MRISETHPFQIVYSLYQHEYLGFLFDPFIVHLDDQGEYTYQHQKISSKNAPDFRSGLDYIDLEIIKLIEEINQYTIIKKFSTKKIKPSNFFSSVYKKNTGDAALQKEIAKHIETYRGKIMDKLGGKPIFEMGKDGEPTWKRLTLCAERATTQFHFSKKPEGTHYRLTVFGAGKPIDLITESIYLINRQPAWLLLCNKLYGFNPNVDGKKLIPFFKRKSIVIPKKLEENYYRNFIASCIASSDNTHTEGFKIIENKQATSCPLLSITEYVSANPDGISLSNNNRFSFELFFRYGKQLIQGHPSEPVSVVLEKQNEEYIFYRITRNIQGEKQHIQTLKKLGLSLKNCHTVLNQISTFSWLNENRVTLLDLGFEIRQHSDKDRKYFIGKAIIDLNIKENIDWFDINAKIFFGEYEISFKALRKLILNKKTEFILPNGEIAVIPKAWITKYSDLFMRSEIQKKPILKKHHITLLKELQENNFAKVSIHKKLLKLSTFNSIKNYSLPIRFQGTLRRYQKVGYNWLRTLHEMHLGGCLADDMGLGKTVQTLALLQAEKEKKNCNTSLLIVPTSLVYNWKKEAMNFTPDLKILCYTGKHRKKNVSSFQQYDLIITSYGIVRLESVFFQTCSFNYIILDESQVIKNPESNTAKVVMQLYAHHRLALTGTPLENTVMDLWSQMNFINPGLLGSLAFFRREYLIPIEKKNDESKTQKLNAIIKPFILRRLKSQIATDLPEKVETIHYSDMTPEQEEKYEETKSYYRNEILNSIEEKGVNNSRFIILKGLTKMRQLANHPKMVDPAYSGDSGKFKNVFHMVHNALLEGHKLLIFSQFVKHLDLVKKNLLQQNIAFSYIDGSSTDRKEQIDTFNTQDRIKIFLISIKAGGLGLNLTKADYVFILDPWWNPAVETQAMDRTHRIGQKRKVFVYKFITRNSIEEKILVLQKRKLQLSDNLITAESTMLKTLTKDDIALLMD